MDELAFAMGELDEDLVLKILCELMESGVNNFSIMRILNSGMLLVGQKFEKGEYFLADLIVSGIIYCKALEHLGIPKKETCIEKSAKVLIGVVKNDVHDIGKDIIVSTLESDGFEVIDLGADVDSEEFVKSAIEQRPPIIAISGTMSYAVEEMRLVIEKLEKKGVRAFSKIAIGGICVNAQKCAQLGADNFSEDPMELLAFCRKITYDKK